MTVLRFVAVGSACVSVFAGSAYVTALSLAPPPQYTVSDGDRLHRYNELAINNAYETKTRMQEFYLGLTRWRRRLLQDEKLLTGRVLEVGAGCGGNLSLYPRTYFTDCDEVRAMLPQLLAAPTLATWRSVRQHGGGGVSAPDVLHNVLETHACDEIVLCDRAANMVDACARKVQACCGYAPYRYPDYDVDRVAAVLRVGGEACAEATAHGVAPLSPSSSSSRSIAATRLVKTMHGDGRVSAVVATPVPGAVDADAAATFLRQMSERNKDGDGRGARGDGDDAAVVVPLVPVSASTLLTSEAQAEMQRRAGEVCERQRLRLDVMRAVRQLRERGTRASSAGAAKTTTTATTTTDDVANPMSLSLLPRGWCDGATPPPLPTTTDTTTPRVAGTTIGGAASDAITTAAAVSGGSAVRLRPQPLFAVAAYAAEQLPFPDNSFDTVVDMFGLCSYDDPVRALRELSRVCKPNGTLLLLEHGKGTHARVNRYLDKWAPRHARQWGCWWNRSIARILRLSGVVVHKHEVRHLGTSHYLVASPYKSMDELDALAASRAATTTTTAAAAAKGARAVAT